MLSAQPVKEEKSISLDSPTIATAGEKAFYEAMFLYHANKSYFERHSVLLDLYSEQMQETAFYDLAKLNHKINVLADRLRPVADKIDLLLLFSSKENYPDSLEIAAAEASAAEKEFEDVDSDHESDNLKLVCPKFIEIYRNKYAEKIQEASDEATKMYIGMLMLVQERRFTKAILLQMTQQLSALNIPYMLVEQYVSSLLAVQDRRVEQSVKLNKALDLDLSVRLSGGYVTKQRFFNATQQELIPMAIVIPTLKIG